MSLNAYSISFEAFKWGDRHLNAYEFFFIQFSCGSYITVFIPDHVMPISPTALYSHFTCRKGSWMIKLYSVYCLYFPLETYVYLSVYIITFYKGETTCVKLELYIAAQLFVISFFNAVTGAKYYSGSTNGKKMGRKSSLTTSTIRMVDPLCSLLFMILGKTLKVNYCSCNHIWI